MLSAKSSRFTLPIAVTLINSSQVSYWLSPWEAVEPAEIEGKIGKLIEEQKDADADKHGSGKSLDPKQVQAQSLKHREKTGKTEGYENERYSKPRRINSQQPGSLPYGLARRSHHQHGGQRGPGARGPAKGEGQPEQEGTELALAYFALNSNVSMQKSNRKPSQKNKPKEYDSCSGDTIQP